MNINARRFLIPVLAILVVPVLAAKSPTPPQLFITGVHVDFGTKTMLIRGENFDNHRDPVVILGDQELFVSEFFSDEIVVELPGEIDDGDYLLTVSTGPAVTHYAAMISASAR